MSHNFADDLAALVQTLQVDRCFLYLRDPRQRTGRVVACHVAGDAWPDLTTAEPSPEPEDLASADPLMGWAFRTPEAIFVDDIDSAGPEILDLGYERDGFGHRALVHAPIYDNGQLFGILEPCVFGAPRQWSAADRAAIASAQERLGAPAAAFVTEGLL